MREYKILEGAKPVNIVEFNGVTFKSYPLEPLKSEPINNKCAIISRNYKISSGQMYCLKVHKKGITGPILTTYLNSFKSALSEAVEVLNKKERM